MIGKKKAKRPASKKEFAKEKISTPPTQKKMSPWQQLLGELLNRMLDQE